MALGSSAPYGLAAEQTAANGQREKHQIHQIDTQPDGREQTAAHLINQIIGQALQCKASDIHLEPGKAELLVKFRCDGQLKQWQPVSRAVAAAGTEPLKGDGRAGYYRKRLPAGWAYGCIMAGAAV